MVRFFLAHPAQILSLDSCRLELYRLLQVVAKKDKAVNLFAHEQARISLAFLRNTSLNLYSQQMADYLYCYVGLLRRQSVVSWRKTTAADKRS